MVYQEIFQKLKAQGSATKAQTLQYFFKCGKGQYGEGDQFLGVTVPEIRALVKAYRNKAGWDDLRELLANPWHDCRLTALLLLVEWYPREPDAVFRFYCSHTDRINNWDLVDLSVYKIVGRHLLHRDRSLLDQWAKSSNLWEVRMAIVATMAFIHQGDCTKTLQLAGQLLNHPHDLIHKATGWMLREVGKRQIDLLRTFLNQYATQMPRTMLRYAIEKLSPTERKDYLARK